MKIIKFIPFAFIFILLSCSEGEKSFKDFNAIYSEIKKEYAPDKRVELFDIQLNALNNTYILEGETTSAEAFTILLDSLNKRKVIYQNKVRVLPDSAVGNLSYAIAKNSVINIRSKPKHSAELGTQGLLGMTLRVLDKKGDFYRVQTPDKYISWVDRGGIIRVNKADRDRWFGEKKIIYNKNFGYVYKDMSENSEIVSDITLGGILKFNGIKSGFFEVEFPDKRKGYVKTNEATYYDSWLYNLNPTKESLENVAKTMTGFPYLWGGTSSKGMDCSGFTKTVYLMNGFIIPRDASQQINAGKTVDKNLDFSDLEKGDLMFFGKKATANKKQRVTHVGIWLGNDKMEFIHSAGNVHLSSMDENEAYYDGFNKNRYLGSRRYLGVKDKMIIDLKEKIKL